MSFSTIVSISELQANLNDPMWAIIDCRFSLENTERGRDDYRQSHIPGAVYAHLDEDLCGPIIRGATGRHPLPSPEDAVRTFAKFGVGPGVQVVLYDDMGGALAAGRAWWMLHWLGHEKAAVLDGGWQKWLSEGFPTNEGVEKRTMREFTSQVKQEMIVTSEEVEILRDYPAFRLCDARTYDRFQGINETIDPVAGHIPGAISAAYMDNLNSKGTFRSGEELKNHYQELMGGAESGKVIFYCGSGVTSILNIIGMIHAGLGAPRLYAGSWSEWITDPLRPVAK